MNDDTEKSSASSAIVLAILVIGVAIYAAAYGIQTLTWYEAHRWTKENPWIEDVPQPLTAAPAAVAKGTQIKAFNYEFTAPWTGKTTHAPSLTGDVIRFDSGEVIVFYDPDTLLDTLRQMKSSSPIQYQKFAAVFADHPIESNYGLYDAVYGVAPSQVSPIMSSRDALRLNELLIWKLQFGIDLRGGMSSFKWGANQGFQFGDPAKGPVALRVFNESNQQFRFIFTVAAGSNAKITQDDIAGIVASFKPVPILER
ncbi:MAG: hypothetical protein WB987_02215 [Candidatus Acidiferrales bacterium]